MCCGNSSYFSPSLEFSGKVQFYVFLNVNTLYIGFQRRPWGLIVVSVSILQVVRELDSFIICVFYM